MVRRLAVLICLMLALTAAPALAGSGNNGLYEPYPSAVASRAAEEFFSQLAVNIDAAQLHAGVFAAGLRAAPTGGPSHRAGLGLAAPSLAPFLIIGALALSAAGLAARRRPLRTAR